MEQRMLKHLDLFSGIGGFSLGLENAGLVKTVAFCDFDKYCQQVLQKNFPGVPVYGDVKELNYDKLKADGINKIDIITGGYPCQPFSVAGRKKGEEDPRHVWPEMFRLIRELKPSWVIGENVGNHVKLGLDTVLSNLESEGYSARTFSISASSIGANHKRERVWIVAHSERLGREPWSEEPGELKNEESSNQSDNCGKGCTKCKSCLHVADANSSGLEEQWGPVTTQEEDQASQCGSWWSVEPDVGRVAHGVPNRVDRLKALGNSIVPQIPFLIGLTIRKILNNNE